MNEQKHIQDETVEALADMIRRSEEAMAKFAPGTAQHTLQVNRIHALKVADALVKQERGGAHMPSWAQEALEKAVAPLRSLASKSEKALQKLASGTWQKAMLERNLRALHEAMPLLEKALAQTSR